MTYDTIVVGAGSACTVVAARLSQDPSRSVLLLEAGPDYATLEETPEEIRRALPRDMKLAARMLGPQSPHDWAYTARATDKLDGIPIPRGRIVGGSSSVNSSIFLRGLQADYDTWASEGNDKWSYERLLPYLRDIEADADFDDDFHGKDGPIPVTRFGEKTWAVEQDSFYRACLSAGYPHCADHNNPYSTGVGPLPLNISDGIRWSTPIAYLNHHRSRPNITIMSESLVRRVLIEDGRAAGVEIEHRDELSRIHSKEVILSAGAIATPQLLMLSGIGPVDGLEGVGALVVHDLTGVGRNLWDHPQIAVTFRTIGDPTVDESAPRLQVGLRYTASGSGLRNDMFILPARFTSHATFDPVAQGSPGLTLVSCLYLERSVGKLRLRSTNPHQQPYIDFNYLADPFDRSRLREGVRLCAELGAMGEFSRLVEQRTHPDDDQLISDGTLDDWMARNVRTSHHAAGTCKMGPESDSMAVVDQHGKLHGIDGLRVADASIMPSGIRANTHLTAVVSTAPNHGARRINPNPPPVETSPRASSKNPSAYLSHGTISRVLGSLYSMVCTAMRAMEATTSMAMMMMVASPNDDPNVSFCSARVPSVELRCVRALENRQSRSAGTPRRHRRKTLDAMPDVVGLCTPQACVCSHKSESISMRRVFLVSSGSPRVYSHTQPRTNC